MWLRGSLARFSAAGPAELCASEPRLLGTVLGGGHSSEDLSPLNCNTSVSKGILLRFSEASAQRAATSTAAGLDFIWLKTFLTSDVNELVSKANQKHLNRASLDQDTP